MSKKSAKPAGPVTRKQQVAALRTLKTQQVASAVAQNIREAVKAEVETQLKAIRDTILSLIDRVLDLETTSVGRTEKSIKEVLAEPHYCKGDE